MWILRWLLFIIVLFFLVGFLTQNADQVVTVRIFGWESEPLQLSFALFLSGVAGYLLCLIIAVINQLRTRGQLSALRRKNRDLQTELDRLRNFALEGDLPGSTESGATEEKSS